MRLLSALGLRRHLHLEGKVAPGKYRVQDRSAHSSVEVTAGDETRTITLPSSDSPVVDLHERSCACELAEEPLTESDLHPVRGCHHLRFADLRILAAPQTVRHVSYKFGIRLGQVLDAFSASHLTEVQETLRDVDEVPVESLEHVASGKSDHSEARVDIERISGIDGTGVLPQYSQERVFEDGERYWIVRTEQDLVGESTGEISGND